eukprot:1152332-Pelagomonas_calceolata.AAC.4
MVEALPLKCTYICWRHQRCPLPLLLLPDASKIAAADAGIGAPSLWVQEVMDHLMSTSLSNITEHGHCHCSLIDPSSGNAHTSPRGFIWGLKLPSTSRALVELRGTDLTSCGVNPTPPYKISTPENYTTSIVEASAHGVLNRQYTSFSCISMTCMISTTYMGHRPLILGISMAPGWSCVPFWKSEARKVIWGYPTFTISW